MAFDLAGSSGRDLAAHLESVRGCIARSGHGPASERLAQPPVLRPVRRYHARVNGWVIAASRVAREDGGMLMRSVSAVLWFICGWYMGAFFAGVFDVSPALGPIFGTAVAALFAGDPRRFIYKRPTARVVMSRPVGEPA
jgi:hypothetical protein